MINLEKPIMVVYVDVSGISPKSRVEENIRNLIESFKFDDINTIILPTRNKEGIEIIWKGKDVELLRSNDDYMNRLQNFLNNIVDNPKDIKMAIRNFNIESIGI